jgi:hypothetical protein
MALGGRMLDHRRNDESCPRRSGFAWRVAGHVVLATALVGVFEAPSSAWAQERKVVVHIDGPEGVELQADTTGNGDWKTVCLAPCDRPLSLDPSYRIDGDHIRSSDVFRLSRDPDHAVALTVHSASHDAFVGGIALVPVGLLTTVIGVLVGFGDYLTHTTWCPEAPESGCRSLASGWPGWVTAGIGVAGVVSGLVLVANNTSSTVTQGGSATATATALPAVSIPMPTWREPTPEAKAAPPLSAVPVWTARF